MLITANSIVNNVGISKVSFPLWEYTCLQKKKKGGLLSASTRCL